MEPKKSQLIDLSGRTIYQLQNIKRDLEILIDYLQNPVNYNSEEAMQARNNLYSQLLLTLLNNYEEENET